MVTRGAQRGSTRTARLPDAIPFGLPAVSRLSWELGSRVVSEELRVVEWEHRTTGRRLAVYDATDHGLVLRVRTPAGRQRFFGAAKNDFEGQRSRLEDADGWRQIA